MAAFNYKTVDLSNGELELARISLLKRIQSESHEASSADSLMDDYNQIVEAQIEQSRSVFDDPIDIFPPEIWIGIIQRAVAYRDGKSIERVLLLTLVSERWRDAILVCPELWAEIKLGPGLGQSDLMTRLQTCLYLSGSYPLSLFIEHPTRDWDNMASVLHPHAARVEAIYIQPLVSKYAGKVDGEEPTVSQILSSFGPLPRLHTLELDTPRVVDWDSFGEFVEEAPLIRKISRRWIPHDVLMKARLEFITEISVRSHPTLLLRWLSKYSSLKFLEHVSDLDHIPNHAILSPSMPRTSIRIMKLHSHIEDHLIGLLMASRRLEELKMRVSWQIMAEFLQILEELPHLDKLDVEIEYLGGPKSVFNPQLERFTSNLRCVSITHSPSLIHGDLSTTESNITRLYEIMENGLSRVEDLKITVTDHFVVPFKYLVSLSRLQTLHLIFRDLISLHLPSFKIELPRVQLLHLQMRPEMMLQVLSSIYCGSISNLWLKGAEEGNNIVTLRTLELDSVAYQTLKTLVLDESLLHWNPTSLNQLQNLLLKSTDSTTASDFCVYLAKRPYDLPNLDKIDFLDYPEWDCLFVMLERRNFLPILGVSPIRRLSFPSILAPSIRYSLINLLRGCFTSRIPNRDLSLVGLGEVYWNQSIPGCHRCCTCMQPCNSPIMGARYRRKPHAKQLVYSEYVEKISSEPPLPLEIETWLSGRQARYKEWVLMKDTWSDIVRRDACDNHELGWKWALSGLTSCDTKGVYLNSLNPYRYLHGKQTNTVGDE